VVTNCRLSIICLNYLLIELIHQQSDSVTPILIQFWRCKTLTVIKRYKNHLYL